MKHPLRLHVLAWCGQPVGAVVIAAAGMISLLGACVVTTTAPPPPAQPSTWGPPGAPSAHPGHAPPGSGQDYAEEYREGEAYAGEGGEGYDEHEAYAGEGYGESDHEGEAYAGEAGEGHDSEGHAGEAGHGEEEHAWEAENGHGAGHAAAPGQAASGDAPGLAALERGIAEEINRMRRDPRGFAQALQRFRGHYQGQLLHLPGSDVPIQTFEGVAAVDEAIQVARRVRPLPPMALSPGLSRAAREHAREIGAAGTIDHTGADGSSPFERMGRHGQVQGMAGENIGTGYEDPAQVVIDLFVDDGVPSRGHRENLLAPQYRVVGVGCAPHRLYGTVCVLDFAEGFVER